MFQRIIYNHSEQLNLDHSAEYSKFPKVFFFDNTFGVSLDLLCVALKESLLQLMKASINYIWTNELQIALLRITKEDCNPKFR